MSHYRIDRMEKVQIIEDDIILPEKRTEFNVGRHKRQLFGMFAGETQKVTFLMYKSLIDVIFDMFGDNVKLRECDDEFIRFSADVQVSPVFLGWCCSFGNQLKVIAPEVVVEELEKYTEELYKNYKEK